MGYRKTFPFNYSREREGEVLPFVKSLPSLIFLGLGSSFIGLPNHLSTHSAVLIGKRDPKNQFEAGISCVHLIKCFASPRRRKAHYHYDANSDLTLPLLTHSCRLHPIIWPPSFTSFLSFWLPSLPQLTSEHLSDTDVKKLTQFDWCLSSGWRINTLLFFFHFQKRGRGEKERLRTASLLCRDSPESFCWQREASWQPQPEVKAPISCG